MRIEDLGQFDGPVVLFGGPYSNLQALEALARVVGNGPAICTGDVVGYCGAPFETVEFIRNLGWPVVAGNCERQVAAGADDCGCGFGEGSACDLLSRGWYAHALASCDAGQRTWMDDLPDAAVFTHDGRRYGVIHGGATTINRFFWASSAEAEFEDEFSVLEQHAGPLDGIVAGHSGIAFQRQIGRRHWINAGVVGLPPHDGRAMTRFGVLERGQVVFKRLEYDVDAAVAQMEVAGLTQGYDAALRSGIWPSEDILPRELRR